MNGQPEGMTWSFVFQIWVGAFDPTATRLSRQVESNVEESYEYDGGTIFNTNVLRACFDLQRKGTAGGQVRFRGVETAGQSWSPVTTPRNASIPLGANESGRPGADNLSMGKQGEGL